MQTKEMNDRMRELREEAKLPRAERRRLQRERDKQAKKQARVAQ